MMAQSTSAMFEALRQKLGPQVQSVRADREDEVYVLLRDADIRPITEHLRGEFGARLVTVFAEDRRSAEGVFFNVIVAKIAKDKKYDYVFEKTMLLFGGEDITYLVVKEMNEK